MGMGIAGRNTQDQTRHSMIHGMNRRTVSRSGATYPDLVRNMVGFGDLLSITQESGMRNHTAVNHTDLNAMFQTALGLSLIGKEIIGGRTFENDCKIRFHDLGRHFGTAATDSLLSSEGTDRIDIEFDVLE